MQIEGVELDKKGKELCYYIEFINNRNRKTTKKCSQKDCELIERIKGKDYVFDFLKKSFLSMNKIDVEEGMRNWNEIEIDREEGELSDGSS